MLINFLYKTYFDNRTKKTLVLSINVGFRRGIRWKRFQTVEKKKDKVCKSYMAIGLMVQSQNPHFVTKIPIQ